MKTIISLASALILGLSAVPVSASAAELDLSPYDFSNCDYNLDGKVSFADANYIFAYYGERQLNPAESMFTAEQLEYMDTYGDINGDGKITAVDSAYLLSYLAENSVPGDVNEDGKLTPADASLILRHYADKATGGSMNDFDTPIEPGAVKWTVCQSLGDINGDGKVSAVDGAEILRIYTDRALAVQ